MILTNFTVAVPDGTTNHGDPSLICTPPTWKNYIVFFATNYFIHAATLPTRPGESMKEVLFAVVHAIFIPGFGAARAIRRLVLRPGLVGRNKLDRAKAAGALGMVVSHDTTTSSNSWLETLFEGLDSYICLPRGRSVHGRYSLPSGFYLLPVPPAARLLPLDSIEATSQPVANVGVDDTNPPPAPTSGILATPWNGQYFQPSCDYNVVKTLFSLVQIVSGALTIYEARGDQLDRYGYGAFGLTVVPYVVMSFVNVVALILSPSYSAVYLVHTPDMDRAKDAGGIFDGVVARLDTAATERGPHDGKPDISWVEDYMLECACVFILIAIAPLSIVGAISHFYTQSSTLDQRAWFMSWLVVGSISAPWSIALDSLLKHMERMDINWDLSTEGLLAMVLFTIGVLFWVPAIGGFVTVGRALQQYGSCYRVSS